MKMEKFEVKQEYKDTEGDPHDQGQTARAVRGRSPIRKVRAAGARARAIITNPIHIAVALEYNPEEEPAPIIVTMGKGPIADQIIKIGLENKIPIMRNVDLARDLYRKGKITDYIPEETYRSRCGDPEVDSSRSMKIQMSTWSCLNEKFHEKLSGFWAANRAARRSRARAI